MSRLFAMIGGLLLILVAAVPFATGFIAQSQISSAYEDLQTQPGVGLQAEPFQRGWWGSQSRLKLHWSQTPEQRLELDIDTRLAHGIFPLWSPSASSDIHSSSLEPLHQALEGQGPLHVKTLLRSLSHISLELGLAGTKRAQAFTGEIDVWQDEERAQAGLEIGRLRLETLPAEQLTAELLRVDWQHQGWAQQPWDSQGAIKLPMLLWQTRHNAPLELRDAELKLSMQQTAPRLVAGQVELFIPTFHFEQQEYRDARLLLNVERLDLPSLQALLAALRQPAPKQRLSLGLWAVQYAPLMLKQNPELRLERFEMQAPEGAVSIAGRGQLQPGDNPRLWASGELDFALPRALLKRISAFQLRRQQILPPPEEEIERLAEAQLQRGLDVLQPPQDGWYRGRWAWRQGQLERD